MNSPLSPFPSSAVPGSCYQSRAFDPFLQFCRTVTAHSVCRIERRLVPVLHFLASPRSSRQGTVQVNPFHHSISIHNLIDRSFIDNGCILIGLSASHSPVTLTVAALIESSLSIKSLLFNIAYFISILFLVFSIYWPYMDRLNKVRGYFSAYPFLIDLLSVSSLEP